MFQKLRHLPSNCSFGGVAVRKGHFAIADAFSCSVRIHHPDGTSHKWSCMRSKELRSIQFISDESLAVSDVKNKQVLIMSLEAVVQTTVHLDTTLPLWKNSMAIHQDVIVIEHPMELLKTMYLFFDLTGAFIGHFSAMTSGGLMPRFCCTRASLIVTNFYADELSLHDVPNGCRQDTFSVRKPYDCIQLPNGFFVVSQDYNKVSLLSKDCVIETVVIPDSAYSSCLAVDVDESLYLKTSVSVYLIRFAYFTRRSGFVRALV